MPKAAGCDFGHRSAEGRDARFGSESVIQRCRLDVRTTLKNGRRAHIGPWLKSANTGCEQSQQTASLFDHLIGAGKQHRRHLQAERLGGLQVEDEFELGRLLDREVGRFGAG
jgi:hypothetical protein